MRPEIIDMLLRCQARGAKGTHGKRGRAYCNLRPGHVGPHSYVPGAARFIESGCPKCGGKEHRTVYHKQGCATPGCRCATCDYGSHAKEHREHLHRFCEGCGFDWLSPTLDTPLLDVGAL